MAQPIYRDLVPARTHYFFARYREHLALNRELAREIEKAAKKPGPLSLEEIQRLSELGAAAEVFVQDGRAPEEHRNNLRSLFFKMFAPNARLQWIWNDGLDSSLEAIQKRYLKDAEAVLRAERGAKSKPPHPHRIRRRARDLAFRDFFLDPNAFTEKSGLTAAELTDLQKNTHLVDNKQSNPTGAQRELLPDRTDCPRLDRSKHRKLDRVGRRPATAVPNLKLSWKRSNP